MSVLKSARTWVRMQLPIPWYAAYQYHFRPELRDPLGGPFNAQKGRQEIFATLMKVLPLKAIIETGTYHGSTTQHMASTTQVPIYTSEANDRAYYYSRLRLKQHPQVKGWLGDSRTFLRDMAANNSVPKSGVFFYLDAHWKADLPLREEVEIVARHWKNSVIMIDDFQVPDDAGYTYDDYGPGKRLCLEYLGDLKPMKLATFFPTLRGDAETGQKRGCTVLADEAIAGQVAAIPLLRKWPQ